MKSLGQRNKRGDEERMKMLDFVFFLAKFCFSSLYGKEIADVEKLDTQ